MPTENHSDRVVDSVPQYPRSVGQYDVLRLIGRGGMGMVCEAVHRRLRRRVALKFLSVNRWKDHEAIRRFDREIEAIGQLQHPHIVQAFDAGECEGVHYLAMELVDGPNVEIVARNSEALAVPDACEIIRQAASGLAYVHSQGLIHRDIKPSNLLLCRSGQVKVADLGLARVAEKLTDDSSLTQTGQVVGTVDFLAPEQGLAGETVTPSADIYSLGCSFYRLLAGRPPFGTANYDTPLKKLQAHVHRPVPEITRTDVPNDIAQLIQEMLHKVASQRPSALQVIERLESFCLQSDLMKLVVATGEEVRDPSTIPTNSLISTDSKQLASTYTATTRDLLRFGWRSVSIRLALGVAAIVFAVTTFGLGLRYRNQVPRQNDVEHSLQGMSRKGADPLSKDPLPVLERTPTSAPLFFEEMAASDIKERVWYTLLNREPGALQWPQGPLALKHFNSEEKQISVNCRSLGMLQLGSVSQTEGYTFQVDLYQNPWSGGVGIFIGWHDEVVEGMPCHRYQVIDLRPRFAADRKEFPLAMWRSIVTIKHPADGKDMIFNEALTSANLPPPERDEQLLEVRVVKGQLSRVRWGGQDIEALTRSEHNAKLLPADYIGAFGTYVSGGEGTYRNARFQAF